MSPGCILLNVDQPSTALSPFSNSHLRILTARQTRLDLPGLSVSFYLSFLRCQTTFCAFAMDHVLIIDVMNRNVIRALLSITLNLTSLEHAYEDIKSTEWPSVC